MVDFRPNAVRELGPNLDCRAGCRVFLCCGFADLLRDQAGNRCETEISSALGKRGALVHVDCDGGRRYPTDGDGQSIPADDDNVDLVFLSAARIWLDQ